MTNFGKYAISDCPFICVFVCLSVCLQHYRKMADLILLNFQDRSNMTQGTMRNILRMFRLTHCTQELFIPF